MSWHIWDFFKTFLFKKSSQSLWLLYFSTMMSSFHMAIRNTVHPLFPSVFLQKQMYSNNFIFSSQLVYHLNSNNFLIIIHLFSLSRESKVYSRLIKKNKTVKEITVTSWTTAYTSKVDNFCFLCAFARYSSYAHLMLHWDLEKTTETKCHFG